jgi:hypothetical protein
MPANSSSSNSSSSRGNMSCQRHYTQSMKASMVRSSGSNSLRASAAKPAICLLQFDARLQ